MTQTLRKLKQLGHQYVDESFTTRSIDVGHQTFMSAIVSLSPFIPPPSPLHQNSSFYKYQQERPENDMQQKTYSSLNQWAQWCIVPAKPMHASTAITPHGNRRARSHIRDVDVVPAQRLPETISYFRAKSLTKIHFSTPLKKIRNEERRRSRIEREKLKSNTEWHTSLLSWIYLCILSSF